MSFDLAAEEAIIRLGGGAKAIARQHEKGRLTARERIAKLLEGDGKGVGSRFRRENDSRPLFHREAMGTFLRRRFSPLRTGTP